MDALPHVTGVPYATPTSGAIEAGGSGPGRAIPKGSRKTRGSGPGRDKGSGVLAIGAETVRGDYVGPWREIIAPLRPCSDRRPGHPWPGARPRMSRQ